MRYRRGERRGYTSRLHYFSEWISDGAGRGLVRDLGGELGGAADVRPLRFMSEHRASYPALRDDATFAEIEAIERRLDGRHRLVVPTKRIPQVVDRIETGDVLAFATEIPGLDVTHAAFAYRAADGVLRVLHAPLSGGVVEITRTTLPQYVAAIRRSTGILVARPAWA
jgi:N-acetylmuramoyl-L-alanine amidase-like protein